jgi:SpoVK/Ycf46/Vps4 family AAA+-type ATPase
MERKGNNDDDDKSLTLDYFLNLLQGALTQDGSIFIATTNHIEVIEPAFYRDGRFDVNINMKLCDHYQLQSIYNKFIKRSISDELLQKIPQNKFTPAKFIFGIKDYIFSDQSDEHILKQFFEPDNIEPGNIDTPVLV